jgi:hypothetical protein
MAIAEGLAATVATPVRRVVDYFREEGTARERTPLERFWHAIRLATLLAPLSLVVGLLWVIWARTAHVPYWDEWEIVLLDQHFKQGTMGFHELVMLHTVHRIIIPRLIQLTIINLTNYNRQVEMTFDLGIAAVSACLLFWSVRRTLGSLNATMALVAPLSLLFFSFAQFGNWLAPFQVQFIITTLGVLCCVTGFITRPASRQGFALAVAGALIGSLSGLHGVLIWIAFLPGALFTGARKAAVWIGCAVVVWVLYFHNFPQSPSRLPIRADIGYSLAYLGGPVAYPYVVRAQIVALLSIVLLLGNVAVYWLRHKTLWPISPWLQLAVFVLGCTQATAQGRVFLGLQQALSSRYQSFTALWWIALVVIMGVNIQDLLRELHVPGRRAYVNRLSVIGCNLAALLLITFALIPANATGLQQALVWQDTQRQDEYAIRDYRTASDSCLELYYPWPGLLRPRAQFLERQRLGIFGAADRSQHPVYGSATTCQKPYQYFIDNVAPVQPGRWVGRSALA